MRLPQAKCRWAFVPDSAAIFESLTGIGYLETVASVHGLSTTEVPARIEQFVSFFDLDPRQMQNEYLGTYSKGTRRKVAIAAGLLYDPDMEGGGDVARQAASIAAILGDSRRG